MFMNRKQTIILLLKTIDSIMDFQLMTVIELPQLIPDYISVKGSFAGMSVKQIWTEIRMKG